MGALQKKNLNVLEIVVKIGESSTIVLHSFTMTCCFRWFLYNLNLTLVEILQMSKFGYFILQDKCSRIVQIFLKFANIKHN